MTTDLRIVSGPIATDDLSATDMHSPAHGAIASFIGVVRDHHRGQAVTHIEYQCYEAMAIPVLESLAAELRAQHATDLAVRVVHATGHVAIGDAAIVIHCASAHRDAAFAACRHMIERIKEDLPVWKHEHYADGTSAWLEGS